MMTELYFISSIYFDDMKTLITGNFIPFIDYLQISTFYATHNNIKTTTKVLTY